MNQTKNPATGPYFKQSTGITREQSAALVASMQPAQGVITGQHYARLPDAAAYIAENGSPLDVPPGERAQLERRMDEAMAKYAAGYQERREAHDRALCDAPVPTMVVNREEWADSPAEPMLAEASEVASVLCGEPPTAEELGLPEGTVIEADDGEPW